ncbi:hypothetical protein MNAN1_001417 [Malassezia nana]|uniref:Uncharacterized protein n=1 Tax=Malassezia nana TaxID=180528 RepID=A0AAF0EIT4_9BASI|nr:hypothetical protein MNAN1_001417 [Malassezia nana]
MEREMERLALVDGDLEMSQEDMNRWEREQNTVAQKISTMNSEIQQLGETLKSYDQDYESLEKQKAFIETKEKELEEEEKTFWHRHERLQFEADELASAQARLQARIKNESLLSASLQSANAYMDTFCIEEDASGMGTINELRLGRRFDHGMVGILTCVKELGECASSNDPTFQLPYQYVVQF